MSPSHERAIRVLLMACRGFPKSNGTTPRLASWFPYNMSLSRHPDCTYHPFLRDALSYCRLLSLTLSLLPRVFCCCCALHTAQAEHYVSLLSLVCSSIVQYYLSTRRRTVRPPFVNDDKQCHVSMLAVARAVGPRPWSCDMRTPKKKSLCRCRA